jgi:hypothetical protein
MANASETETKLAQREEDNRCASSRVIWVCQ